MQRQGTESGRWAAGKWRRRHCELFIMASASVVFLAFFAYAPMYGIALAFKDGDRQLSIIDAMSGTDWVGLSNFRSFLLDSSFRNVFVNTLVLNVLMLLIIFPLPILFALLLNEVRHFQYKKTIQTIANFPHFLSWAIYGGIVLALTDMTTGVVTPLLNFLGIASKDNPVNLNLAQYFWAEIIVVTAIKSVGWGSIVYSAAIAGISSEMYEAAEIDGAGRFQKMLKITLPSIAPTITVFLLLNISTLLSNSYEQFIVFQNTLNLDRSEVLATYGYKMGLGRRRYSYATAMSLFESFLSIILLVSSNLVSKKLTGRGLY